MTNLYTDKCFSETDAVSPVIAEAEHESSLSHTADESPDSPVPSSPVIDADLARMEALLDNWCLDLKRNVLVCDLHICTDFKTSNVEVKIYSWPNQIYKLTKWGLSKSDFVTIIIIFSYPSIYPMGVSENVLHSCSWPCEIFPSPNRLNLHSVKWGYLKNRNSFWCRRKGGTVTVFVCM